MPALCRSETPCFHLSPYLRRSLPGRRRSPLLLAPWSLLAGIRLLAGTPRDCRQQPACASRQVPVPPCSKPAPVFSAKKITGRTTVYSPSARKRGWRDPERARELPPGSFNRGGRNRRCCRGAAGARQREGGRCQKGTRSLALGTGKSVSQALHRAGPVLASSCARGQGRSPSSLQSHTCRSGSDSPIFIFSLPRRCQSCVRAGRRRSKAAFLCASCQWERTQDQSGSF